MFIRPYLKHAFVMALIYVIFMINSNLKTSLGEVGPSSINVGAIGGGLGMLSRFKLALLNYQCFVRLKILYKN